MPGLYVTANLYLPKEPAGKLPAVVYVSGHAPGPWGAKVQYQHHGIWFARHGYAAILLDTMEFGEVPGIHHGTHDLGMWYWHSLGYTPAGSGGLERDPRARLSETRPEVDARRVAVTGISGGGAVTWFTAAGESSQRPCFGTTRPVVRILLAPTNPSHPLASSLPIKLIPPFINSCL
jgi:dienelactone hydrolase